MASTGSLYGACIPTFESSKVFKVLSTKPASLFHDFAGFLSHLARLDGVPEDALETLLQESSLQSLFSILLLESQEKLPMPTGPEEGPGKEGS